jgi:hypothetical protein
MTTQSEMFARHKGGATTLVETGAWCGTGIEAAIECGFVTKDPRLKWDVLVAKVGAK